LIGLKLDAVISIENWVPMVLGIFAYMILVADKLYAFFEKNAGAQNYNSNKSNNNENYFSNNAGNNFESEKHF